MLSHNNFDKQVQIKSDLGYVVFNKVPINPGAIQHIKKIMPETCYITKVRGSVYLNEVPRWLERHYRGDLVWNEHGVYVGMYTVPMENPNGWIFEQHIIKLKDFFTVYGI